MSHKAIAINCYYLQASTVTRNLLLSGTITITWSALLLLVFFCYWSVIFQDGCQIVCGHVNSELSWQSTWYLIGCVYVHSIHAALASTVGKNPFKMAAWRPVNHTLIMLMAYKTM